MTGCDAKLLEAYLDRALAPDRRAAVEAHLADCRDCRAQVERWHEVEQRIRSWADARSHEPSEIEVRRLVERARGREERSHGAWGFGLALGGAVAIVLVVAGLWPARGPHHAGPAAPGTELGLVLHGPGGAQPASGPVAGRILDAGNAPLRAELGGDHLALSRDARVRVVSAVPGRTHLSLEAGAVLADVEPRHAGEVFRIDAGKVAVEVVGTRFRVAWTALGDVEVAVRRGEVRVTIDGVVQSVHEGQQARLDASGAKISQLPPAEQLAIDAELGMDTPAVPPPPDAAAQVAEAPAEDLDLAEPSHGREERRSEKGIDLGPWRKMILAGDYVAADAGLAAIVARRPQDAEAWSLLADCRRKAGQAREAVAAYRKVIDLADPAFANRARLLAASLLQDKLGDPGGAAPLLRDYLGQRAHLRQLEGTVMVRLARALLQLGKDGEATGLLEKVIRDHGDSPAASDARKLLQRR